MTCAAFSIKSAKTNQNFSENSEFCEFIHYYSKLFTGVLRFDDFEDFFGPDEVPAYEATDDAADEDGAAEEEEGDISESDIHDPQEQYFAEKEDTDDFFGSYDEDDVPDDFVAQLMEAPVPPRVERFDRRGTEPFEPFESFEFFQNRNLP